MALLLDTSVAILLRDGDERIGTLLAEQPGSSLISIVSRVELEGGVYRDPAEATVRRLRLDRLLEAFEVLPFEDRCAEAYRQIVEARGFSRPRVLDRMIAATALAAGTMLATCNAADFRDVPGLEVLDWG